MDETYDFKENDKFAEAREAEDDIDAFERKLRGEAPTQKAVSKRASVPAPKAGGMKSGSHYVRNAVKPAASEADAEADEAKRDVSDLPSY